MSDDKFIRVVNEEEVEDDEASTDYQLNYEEKAALAKAVVVVKKQAASYIEKGLSPSSFFSGQINIAFTMFMLGHSPEYYWIFQALKCYFYLGMTWKHKLKHKEEILYLTEFCWVACHVYMIHLTQALLGAAGVVSPWTTGCTNDKMKFYLYWGLANGPFAFSVIIFKNALVLHDLPNLASAFIHLTPSSLTWSLRWYAP